jgi:hypothetical protein
MNKKAQKLQAAKSTSEVYYIVYILHRIVLCLTVILTGIYWATLVAIMVFAAYIRSLPSDEIKNAANSNTVPELIAHGLRETTLKWAVMAAAFSLLLLTIVRFRKYEKPLIIDGVVIALFCLLSALFAQAIVRLIYSPF